MSFGNTKDNHEGKELWGMEKKELRGKGDRAKGDTVQTKETSMI